MIPGVIPICKKVFEQSSTQNGPRKLCETSAGRVPQSVECQIDHMPQSVQCETSAGRVPQSVECETGHVPQSVQCETAGVSE